MKSGANDVELQIDFIQYIYCIKIKMRQIIILALLVATLCINNTLCADPANFDLSQSTWSVACGNEQMKYSYDFITVPYNNIT